MCVCVCVYICVCIAIDLDKLDAEMLKLLAWQRIQQLFPPKVPSTPPPLEAIAPKTSSAHTRSKTFTYFCHSLSQVWFMKLMFCSLSMCVCFISLLFILLIY